MKPLRYAAYAGSLLSGAAGLLTGTSHWMLGVVSAYVLFQIGRPEKPRGKFLGGTDADWVRLLQVLLVIGFLVVLIFPVPALEGPLPQLPPVAGTVSFALLAGMLGLAFFRERRKPATQPVE